MIHTYLLQTSEPLITINGKLQSRATVCAKKVFPTPEGPYNRIPFGTLKPVKCKENDPSFCQLDFWDF